MNDHVRNMDKWLKWMAFIGPFVAYVLGLGSGALAAYQTVKGDHAQVVLLSNWKEKQTEFNQTTVAAIARLNAMIGVRE